MIDHIEFMYFLGEDLNEDVKWSIHNYSIARIIIMKLLIEELYD